MIKRSHFDSDGHFHPGMFLTDYNPNSHIYILTKSPKQYFIEHRDKINEILLSDYKLLRFHDTFLSKGIVVLVYESYNDITDTECLSISVTITGDTVSVGEDILKDLADYQLIENVKELPKINLISIRHNNPSVITKYLSSKLELDINNSYNLSCKLDSISDIIKSNQSGLLLFTGDPGTGKTSLIKYLSQENQDKDFYYLSNDNFDILSNPNFVEFCINRLKDGVIVLEDCERLLLSRKTHSGYDISNVLNLTSGIMGDLFNIKIIATLNTYDKLDEALLRKGRLLSKVQFNKLTGEQATNLSKTIGKNQIFKKDVPLCDVYNEDSNGAVQNESTKIGFTKQIV